MPIEFTQIAKPAGSSSDTARLSMMYDGSGRRISKTRMRDYGNGVWETQSITHYTDIGTEVRENYAEPAKQTKVVVNMPEGLSRYKVADKVTENFTGQELDDETKLSNHGARLLDPMIGMWQAQGQIRPE